MNKENAAINQVKLLEVKEMDGWKRKEIVEKEENKMRKGKAS